MAITIQLRRDTSANWSSNNPTLASGEIAIATDLGKIKIGDGTTVWSALNYVNLTPTEITSAINLAITNLVDSSPAALNTLNELAAAINDDPDFYNTIVTALSAKAPLASPTFTGTVTVPTPVNSTDAVTKAYADTKAPLSSPTFTGTVTVPTPVNATDAATKAYVDSNQGLSPFLLMGA
jgi:hypothetical protein